MLGVPNKPRVISRWPAVAGKPLDPPQQDDLAGEHPAALEQRRSRQRAIEVNRQQHRDMRHVQFKNRVPDEGLGDLALFAVRRICHQGVNVGRYGAFQEIAAGRRHPEADSAQRIAKLVIRRVRRFPNAQRPLAQIWNDGCGYVLGRLIAVIRNARVAAATLCHDMPFPVGMA